MGKEERLQTNNLSFYFKKITQEDKNKPILRTRKEIKKIRAEINETRN